MKVLFTQSSPFLPYIVPFKKYILLGILFSNTLMLSFSLSVRDQVSYSYKTRGKIPLMCILGSRPQDKRFALIDSKYFLTSVCSRLLHEWNFNLQRLVPVMSNVLPFQGRYYRYLCCVLDLRIHDHVLHFLRIIMMMMILQLRHKIHALTLKSSEFSPQHVLKDILRFQFKERLSLHNITGLLFVVGRMFFMRDRN